MKRTEKETVLWLAKEMKEVETWLKDARIGDKERSSYLVLLATARLKMSGAEYEEIVQKVKNTIQIAESQLN